MFLDYLCEDLLKLLYCFFTNLKDQGWCSYEISSGQAASNFNRYLSFSFDFNYYQGISFLGC